MGPLLAVRFACIIRIRMIERRAIDVLCVAREMTLHGIRQVGIGVIRHCTDPAVALSPPRRGFDLAKCASES
jgi:hypothetical protein